MTNALWRALKLPDKLSLSEWSARNVILSSECSASIGHFHAFPYQVGITDAMSDPANETRRRSGVV